MREDSLDTERQAAHAFASFRIHDRDGTASTTGRWSRFGAIAHDRVGVTGAVHHADCGYHVVGMKAADAPDIAVVKD